MSCEASSKYNLLGSKTRTSQHTPRVAYNWSSGRPEAVVRRQRWKAPAGRPTGDGSGFALNGCTAEMSGNQAPISQCPLRSSQNGRGPSLRPHSYGVPVGNAESRTLGQSKRLKTRLSKHTRAACFEPSKAGLLSLQTLNLSEEMSGN